MSNRYDDNSYNYSFLSTNLLAGSQKIRKINRMLSPVEIKSYGPNNFLVELNYRKKEPNNDEYDYIEKELKKNTNKTKAYTTYTQISSEDNFFFSPQMKKPSPKYNNNNNNPNYITYYPEEIYISNNDNNFINNNNYHNATNINGKNFNYIMYKKEDPNVAIYPPKRIYLTKINPNNNNKINIICQSGKKRNDFKYQSFGASFISNSNRSSKKNMFLKKENVNITHKSLSPETKEKTSSKSKNQLHDFNIDKLKEIGDSLALRIINKRKKIPNKSNINNINKIDNNANQKNKHDSIINKIIMIEEKRKQSKNKLKLMNKSQNNNDIKKDKKNNNIRKIQIKNKKNRMNEIKLLDDSNYRNKILKINNNIKLKNCRSPDMRKIALNDQMNRKKYIDKSNIINIELEGKHKKNNSNSRNNFNYKNKNLCNSYAYSYINNNNCNSYRGNKIGKNDKKIYVNTNIIQLDKSKGNETLRNKNNNHNYLETIYIKENQKVKQTQHSFNNILLPLQQ